MNPEENQNPLPENEEYKVVYTAHEDLEPISIPEQETKLAMQSLQEQLSAQQLWINHFNALDQLRKLIKGNYQLVVPYLATSLLNELKSALLNLRSSVAKNALLLIQTLFNEPRSEELLPFVVEILPLLLGRLTSAKHFIQVEIKLSLEKMAHHLLSLEMPLIIHEAHIHSKAALAPLVIDFVATLQTTSFRAILNSELLKSMDELNLQKLCPLFQKYWEGRCSQKKAIVQVFQVLVKKFTKAKVEEAISGIEGVQERTKESIKRGIQSLEKKRDTGKKLNLKDHIRLRMQQRKKQMEEDDAQKDKLKIKVTKTQEH